MHKGICDWIKKSKRRTKILTSLMQPMTAKQMAKITGLREDCCSYVLQELSAYRLVCCLNSQARRSRLYWLTEKGIKWRQKLLKMQRLPICAQDYPVVDWRLYGWACYNHRSAVIKAITKPMKCSRIRKKIVQDNPDIKISANNVSDIIQLLLAKGIVETVQIHKKSHHFYRLTETGIRIHQLLIKTECI